LLKEGRAVVAWGLPLRDDADLHRTGAALWIGWAAFRGNPRREAQWGDIPRNGIGGARQTRRGGRGRAKHKNHAPHGFYVWRDGTPAKPGPADGFRRRDAPKIRLISDLVGNSMFCSFEKGSEI
jgi:hypothetical protein